MNYNIDVIIPVYNRQELLIRAINSVLNQTYSNYKLIIVDDGSTDKTKEMIAEKFPNIEYFYQTNKGVSSARNLGIRNSDSELIAFLDSDDEWHKDKLKKQIEFLKSKPEYSICQTKEKWIRNGKFINPGKKHLKISGDLFAKSLEQCFITPSSVLLKRELLNEFGYFNECLPACEDYDLWIKITSKYSVGLIDEDLMTRFAGHNDQLSNTAVLDKYRIIALDNFISGDFGNIEQKNMAFMILEKKTRIYTNGLIKRDKIQESQIIKNRLIEVNKILTKDNK